MLTWLSLLPKELESTLANAFLVGLTRDADDGVPNTFPGGERKVNVYGQPVSGDPNLPRLKTEVARGLLVNSGMKLAAGALKGNVAGEIGWTKNGLPVAWNAPLTPQDMSILKSPDQAGFDSTMIGHFLWEILEEDESKSMERLNLDDKRLKSLKVNPPDVIGLIRKSADAEERALQPIFAYELKALMHQYARMVKSDESGL